MSNRIISHKLDEMENKAFDKLSNRIKKMKVGGKIGAGILGVGTGLGTYYLLNRNKKK